MKRDAQLNKKRILMLLILGIFLFAFALQFVSAAQHLDLPKAPSGEEKDSATDYIRDLFANWERGQFSDNVAKYLLWVLISIIVYSIESFIPGIGKRGYIKGIFAIIVGFLSIAYITPDEIYSLMTAYNALGFAIGIGLPFLILLSFTYQISSQNLGGKQRFAGKLLAFLLWGIFTVFTFMRALEADSGRRVLSWSLFGIAILVTFATSSIIDRLSEGARESIIQKASDRLKLSTAHIKGTATATEELGGE